MTEKKETKKTQKTLSSKRKPEKSKRKISLKEFFIGKDIPRVKIAGFSATIEPGTYHFREEWEELFEKYQKER